MHIYDGKPHPSMGLRDFDASIYTRRCLHDQRQPDESWKGGPNRDHLSVPGRQDEDRYPGGHRR
jgi:hypothetical protein